MPKARPYSHRKLLAAAEKNADKRKSYQDPIPASQVAVTTKNTRYQSYADNLKGGIQLAKEELEAYIESVLDAKADMQQTTHDFIEEQRAKQAVEIENLSELGTRLNAIYNRWRDVRVWRPSQEWRDAYQQLFNNAFNVIGVGEGDIPLLPERGPISWHTVFGLGIIPNSDVPNMFMEISSKGASSLIALNSECISKANEYIQERLADAYDARRRYLKEQSRLNPPPPLRDSYYFVYEKPEEENNEQLWDD